VFRFDEEAREFSFLQNFLIASENKPTPNLRTVGALPMAIKLLRHNALHTYPPSSGLIIGAVTTPVFHTPSWISALLCPRSSLPFAAQEATLSGYLGGEKLKICTTWFVTTSNAS
jgi:hypothetical protein